MGLDPNHDQKMAFQQHWAGVTKARASLTFDDVPPNHDHFVVIPEPARAKGRKTGQGQARKAKARPAIPVVML